MVALQEVQWYNTPQEVKEQAVIDLCSRRESAKTIAQSYGITREALYKWKDQLLSESGDTAMPKKDAKRDEKDMTVEKLISKLAKLKKDVVSPEKLREDLQREVYRLQMERNRQICARIERCSII